ASGMVTGVGFDAPSSCAAIRVGITGFVETGFSWAVPGVEAVPGFIIQGGTMEVNVADTVDPGFRKLIMDLQSRGQSVIEMPGMSNGISRMVTKVTRVATPGSIDVLPLLDQNALTDDLARDHWPSLAGLFPAPSVCPRPSPSTDKVRYVPYARAGKVLI